MDSDEVRELGQWQILVPSDDDDDDESYTRSISVYHGNSLHYHNQSGFAHEKYISAHN